jgi:hypothetical protein
VRMICRVGLRTTSKLLCSIAVSLGRTLADIQKSQAIIVESYGAYQIMLQNLEACYSGTGCEELFVSLQPKHTATAESGLIIPPKSSKVVFLLQEVISVCHPQVLRFSKSSPY